MTRACSIILLCVLLLAACVSAAAPTTAWHLVPGTFEPGRGPDGNSIFLDAPDGLILVDTGRHPAHRNRLLAYAAERGRPIAAIVNTHWHLDHSTGNREIRAAFPRAQLYATAAVEGAIRRFFPQSRADAERFLASGQATPEQRAEIARGFAVMDDPGSLRATRPVTRSGRVTIAGRRLDFHVAPFAATAADLWIHDPAARLVIAGDLVVAPVPFMDTACAEGWRRALEEIAATDFDTLIPGHGAAMSRADFMRWRQAFDAFVACGGSQRPREQCVAGWVHDAAPFIAPDGERLIREMAGYYLDTRLRAQPEERLRWCRS